LTEGSALPFNVQSDLLGRKDFLPVESQSGLSFLLDDNFGASLELKQIDYVHKQFHKNRVKKEALE
jgi:hypothetical protein